MAILRINHFRATAEKQAALREFLASIIGLIETSPGCLRCELATDAADESRFVIIEKWETVEAHQAAAARVPAEMLAAFRPLVAEPPTGQYYELSG